MATREELHALVDSLANGALDSAHRALSHMQVWPPVPPPEAAAMPQLMEERRIEIMQRQKPGTIGGFGGHSNYDSARQWGASAFTYWEDDTCVTETLRRHKGHELRIVERIRIADGLLSYKHEVRGPGEKHDEREMLFDI